MLLNTTWSNPWFQAVFPIQKYLMQKLKEIGTN